MTCRFSGSTIERFYRKLEPRGDCVEWTGCISPFGYGGLSVRPFGRLFAHRVAWELAHGRPPTGVVRHSCDNRKCCNPKHLIEGSQKENIRDCIERGRFCNPPKLQGAEHGNAALVEWQVHEIRCRRTRGELTAAIAKAFGVSDSLVSAITTGKAWSTVLFETRERKFDESRTCLITLAGETLTIAGWSRRLGIKKSTLGRRLRKGWPPEKALSQSIRHWRRRK